MRQICDYRAYYILEYKTPRMIKSLNFDPVESIESETGNKIRWLRLQKIIHRRDTAMCYLGQKVGQEKSFSTNIILISV